MNLKWFFNLFTKKPRRDIDYLRKLMKVASTAIERVS